MTMKACLLLFLFLLIVGNVYTKKFEVNSESSEKSNTAKNQLQKIREQATHMQYGACWTKALGLLQSGCRRLTDDVQRRIAYAFARCHFQASGREIPECPEEKPILECTNADVISESVFGIYTDFFTHTQQICFHLQNQIWHEATENTISRLADNSEDVAAKLEVSANVANEMIAHQNKSLQNQEILLQNEERLKDSMQQSVLDVQRSHAETKAIISEQRALFSEVFDRVAVLQKTVLGEFSSIYTFGFYVGSTLMAYVLTSTTRTSSARIWLFFILMLNAAAERFVTQYYVSEIDGGTSFASGSLSSVIPELIYEQTWLCRHIFSGLAMLVLIISVCRYKDYNKINNTLLNEIKQQNAELQNYIRDNINDGVVSKKSTALVKNEDMHDESIGKKVILAKHQSDINSVATISHGESNVSVLDADSTLRPSNFTTTNIDLSDSGSEGSDHTFRQSEITYADSETSSITSIISVNSRSSRSASAAPRIDASRRSSTPLRDEFTNATRVTVKRTRRKSSIMATLSDSNTSHIEPPSDGVIVAGYNLRRRPASPLINRTILEKETVKDFTNFVLHNLAADSAFKRKQITQHLAYNK